MVVNKVQSAPISPVWGALVSSNSRILQDQEISTLTPAVPKKTFWQKLKDCLLRFFCCTSKTSIYSSMSSVKGEFRGHSNLKDQTAQFLQTGYYGSKRLVGDALENFKNDLKNCKDKARIITPDPNHFPLSKVSWNHPNTQFLVIEDPFEDKRDNSLLITVKEKSQLELDTQTAFQIFKPQDKDSPFTYQHNQMFYIPLLPVLRGSGNHAFLNEFFKTNLLLGKPIYPELKKNAYVSKDDEVELEFRLYQLLNVAAQNQHGHIIIELNGFTDHPSESVVKSLNKLLRDHFKTAFEVVNFILPHKNNPSLRQEYIDLLKSYF